jgi:hypothetical protein
MNTQHLIESGIRKVKVLTGPARAQARELRLADDCLVIIRTTLEVITGSPVTYLQDRMMRGKRKAK